METPGEVCSARGQRCATYIASMENRAGAVSRKRSEAAGDIGGYAIVLRYSKSHPASNTPRSIVVEP